MFIGPSNGSGNGYFSAQSSPASLIIRNIGH